VTFIKPEFEKAESWY